MAIINLMFNKDAKNNDEKIITTLGEERFRVPDILFGTTKEKALRVWNDYIYFKKSTGVLLTGDAGSGKTLVGMILANIAIDHGLEVFMLNSKIRYNDNIDVLISYLNNLRNCVVFIDEFAKLLGFTNQDSFLTMLSDLNKTNKIFILTENDTSDVNRYILNRPGRIKYHYDYRKLEKSVITEYCSYKNINNEFTEDLLNVYKRVNKFTFDQLQAIVDEHLKYPDENIDTILDILNVSDLRQMVRYSLVSVFDKGKQKYLDFKPMKGLSERNVGLNYWDTVEIQILKDNLNGKNPPYSDDDYITYTYKIKDKYDGGETSIIIDDTVVLNTPVYTITYKKE